MNFIPNCYRCGDNVDVGRHDDGFWFCDFCNFNKYRICKKCGKHLFEGDKPDDKSYTPITCSDCETNSPSYTF